MVNSRLLPALLGFGALIAPVSVAAQSVVNIPGAVKSTSGPSASNARLDSSGQNADTSVPGLSVVPKAYIVELKPSAGALDGRSAPMHERFHKRAEGAKLDYQVRREFTDTSLFHGLSVQLSKDEDKAVLEKLPEVSRVWPVVLLQRPEPVGLGGFPNSKVVAGSPGDGLSMNITRGQDYKIDYNLKQAGLEHLHSKGIKGKGVKVAIIDTGVDYNHPALGGGFGPGKKIGFGRNYVTDDGQGDANDPIATCAGGGHGSHVAGIIAGEDPADYGFGLIGVAPEATLGMYRVFACSGDASNDVVMQAMIDAYNDGANVVSMSLGSDNGFEDADPNGQIITNAKKRGIVTVIAAGNRGNLGPMLTSSPAIAKDAIAVASSDGAKYPTTYKMKGSTGGEFRYSSLWPLDGEFTFYADPDYDLSYGCDYTGIVNAVQTVQERGWDISKTFFMVRQGYRCDLGSTLVNIVYQGFKGVLVWRDQEFANPQDNDYEGSAPGSFILSVDNIDGPKLYAAVVASGANFRGLFTDKRFLPVDNPSAGFTSNYSTIGNTWEFNVFKPQIAAPGHLILSSWPLEVGGYAIISGTSMATPFVAGCYAVLKSAYPNLTVDELTNLFTSTAVPSKWWGDKQITHSVTHQGAGIINVWNAYNSGTKFQEGTVLVGEGDQPVTRNITFTNTLDHSKTFDISHAPAGLMQRTPYADLDVVGYGRYGFPSKAIYATVGFSSPTKVTLGPGESTTIEFVVSPPSGLDPDTIPIYSGYISITSGRDIYSIPYQGLTYIVNEVPLLERDLIPDTPELPAMAKISASTGAILWPEGDVVEYNTSNGFYEYPSMVYFARQPSYVFRLDLVAANTTFKPTYFGFNTANVIETSTPDLAVVDTFGGVDSFNVIFGMYYLPPIYHILSWWGGYTNEDGQDVLVPAGDYRFLLRLLPVEKDYDVPGDWVSWLGPVLRIVQ